MIFLKSFFEPYQDVDKNQNRLLVLCTTNDIYVYLIYNIFKLCLI